MLPTHPTHFTRWPLTLEPLAHIAIHVLLPPPKLAGAHERDPLAVIERGRFGLAARTEMISLKLVTTFDTAFSMFIGLEASCHDISARTRKLS